MHPGNRALSVRIVFLCTGNRARSQMAEGLARAMSVPEVEVTSAGTRPNPKGVHPIVVEMLRDRGIDASVQRPKHIDELAGEFDYVITLCDTAARECPSFPARRARMQWGLPDPDVAGGEPSRERALFAEMRDDLERELRIWLGSLGLAKPR